MNLEYGLCRKSVIFFYILARFLCFADSTATSKLVLCVTRRAERGLKRDVPSSALPIVLTIRKSTRDLFLKGWWVDVY